jgi:putative sterol carrier protein
MTDATTLFFERLARRGHEPFLAKVSGTLRFDLPERGHIDHWLVMIDNGDVRVSREDRDADTIVSVDPGLFDCIVRGEANALAALLRADLIVEGNLPLMVRLERLFPGPPTSLGPRRVVRDGTRP